jgi:uncharacterized membrane protein (DUF485 family)
MKGVPVAEQRTETDWEAIERSPEFQELTRSKRAFVVPATIFFMVWYFGFIALCGYAPDFMGRKFVTDGLTVGYVLALTQFLMSWVLAAWYVRRANRTWDPLAVAVRDSVDGRPDGEPAAGARFRRDGVATEQEHEEVPQR